MGSLKVLTTSASLKAEGYALTPVNESPTSIEGHGTMTDNQPTNSASAEGHIGTFARFFLLFFYSSRYLIVHQHPSLRPLVDIRAERMM